MSIKPNTYAITSDSIYIFCIKGDTLTLWRCTYLLLSLVKKKIKKKESELTGVAFSCLG